LTRAMARGEEAAFREFYEAYFDRLRRYLIVVARGDEHAAREALQLALVRVARHVKPFASEAAFWGWLTVLARHALTDEARKQRRWFAFRERFARHTETASGSDDDGGAAEARLRELLAQGVAALPPEERELVAQKYFEGRSVRDLATARQTTEKAVESRLARLRAKLKAAVLARLKEKDAHDE